MGSNEEFYAPDEPLAELLDAYAAGTKGITARPAHEATSSASARISNPSGNPLMPSGQTFTHSGAPVRFTTGAETFTVTQRTA